MENFKNYKSRSLDDEWMYSWQRQHPASKKQWDLNSAVDREVALKFIKKNKPSRLRIFLDGTERLMVTDFLTTVANEQYSQKRDFIFEGALNLPQWHCNPLERLRQKQDVLQSITPHGSLLSQKSRVISNQSIMMEKLQIRLKQGGLNGLNFKRFGKDDLKEIFEISKEIEIKRKDER